MVLVIILKQVTIVMEIVLIGVSALYTRLRLKRTALLLQIAKVFIS